jgi:hypothetical protein
METIKTGGELRPRAGHRRRRMLAALALVSVLLDVEMALCQLLCANCHARKTWGYEASTMVF